MDRIYKPLDFLSLEEIDKILQSDDIDKIISLPL